MKILQTILLVTLLLFGQELAGQSNTEYGQAAGNAGIRNSAFGYDAGGSVERDENSFFGYKSGSDVDGSDRSSYFGAFSGQNATWGSDNTLIGYYSGQGLNLGARNTFLGSYSGAAATGSDNIFIGYNSGYNETGSNKLYIDNSSTSSPLIWGDFSTNDLKLNGDVEITDVLTLGFAKVSGTANRSGLLKVNKAGGQTWSGISIEHTTSSAWSLMGDQDDFGLYDDQNNEWAVLYNENNSLELYYNGSKKLNTTSGGVSVTGSITSSGTVSASGGTSSNWNTAYSERGSQIAGTGLNWSGGQLNVSFANTDDQTISLSSNTLSIESGNSVNLSSYLDNTDNQDLSLSGATLNLTGDGTSVDLSNLLTDNLGNHIATQHIIPNSSLINLGSSINPFGKLYLSDVSIHNSANDQVVRITSSETRLGSKSFQTSLGASNTGVGVNAGKSNTFGARNTAVGSNSLLNNTNGDDNTGMGKDALQYNATGNFNTAVGSASGPSSSSTNLANTTTLGYGATVTSSNTVRIGNSSVTSIGGQVSWSTLSDGRFKTALKEDVPGLDFINQLRPVSYQVDVQKLSRFLDKSDSASAELSKKPTSRAIGFVAQEVQEILEKTGSTFSGVEKPTNEQSHYSLRYAEFVVPLSKAVQELSSMIQDQNVIIEELRKEVAQLRTSNSSPERPTIEPVQMDEGVELLQNRPNPFTEKTTIDMSLPENISKAKIIIYDLRGTQLKTIPVRTRGATSVSIPGYGLDSGMYIYALIADGMVMATKKMILTK